MARRIYICSECGGIMKKADSEVLVCIKCGYSVNVENYSVFGDETWYDSVFEAESFTGRCDNFPEEYPPVDYEDTDGDEN